MPQLFEQVLLTLVLWKDSLDYLNIVKGKNMDREALSLEEKVDMIVEEHRRGEPAQSHFDIELINSGQPF